MRSGARLRGWAGATVGLVLTAAASGQTITADECGGATVISGTGTFSFNNQNATASTNPAAFSGSISMTADVWGRWTAPQTGWVTLSMCAASRGLCSIYLGGDCATMVPYAVGDRDPSCFEHVAQFWVEQGQAYTFRLEASRGTRQFTLSYGTAFPGDDCHNALEISGAGLFPFDNSGATSQYTLTDPYQYCQNDVWYRWTAPAAGQTYIHTCDTMVFSGPGLYLFDDVCPAPAGEIVGNVGAAGCNGARIDFIAEAGRSYLIRLGSTNEYARTTNGQFEIVQVGTTGGGGETIVVTTAFDVVDITGAQNYSTLPGPDGRVSFREACIAANNTPGGQRIEFSVPQSEWYYPVTTFPYAALHNSGGDPFYLNDDETVIDGSTQTVNQGDTNPNGWDVGFWGGNPNAGLVPNIIIEGDRCLVKDMLGAGFIGHSLWVNGNDNRIIGCQFTQSIQSDMIVNGDNTLVGGTEPGEGNTIQGLLIQGGAQNTVVVGNRLIGVGVRGGAANTRIGGPSLAERNIIGGAGGYVGEGLPTGSQIGVGALAFNGGGATGTLIENNYIGVAADGVTWITQVGPYGVYIDGGTGTIVRNNVISECYQVGINHYAGEVFGAGLYITGNSAGTMVQGNLIGTDAFGLAGIRNLVGLRFAGDVQNTVFPSDTLVGGEGPGEGNLIAFSEAEGVLIGAGVSGVRLLGNSIRDNAGLGIDLWPLGVNGNDPLDADTGANGLQNAPVLTSAWTDGTAGSAGGALHSTPGRPFRIELFASPACDPSGHGEGRELLGAAAVTTGASGDASFTAAFIQPATPGWVLAATATDLVTNETSEFSACLTIALGGGCSADRDGDGDADVFDLLAYLDAWFAGAAAADVDGLAGVDVFDLLAYLDGWFAGC